MTARQKPFGRKVAVALATVLTGAVLPVSLSAAEYVGSDTCAECHLPRYRQLTNSIHSKMIRKISVDGTIPSTQPSMVASVSHIHGNLSAAKAPPPSEVTYAIGGWYKEESYLKEGIDPVTSKATFNVTKYEWDPINGTYRDDRDGTRNWLTQCAGCHSTGYNPLTQNFAEINVGCEACHGPGSQHVISENRADIVIDRSSEGCGFCHIRAQSVATGSFTNKQFNFPIGYQLGQPQTLQFIPQSLSDTNSSFFPDGTSKRHRQQYLDVHYPGFRVTKHYEKNVTCTSCHDPHTSGALTAHVGIPAGANAPTNGIYGIAIYDNAAGATNFVEWDGEGLKTGVTCTTCHTGSDPKHVHYFTAKAMAATLDCVDCHMPDVINVNRNTLRGALHTHTFRSMRPEISNRYGPDNQANACTYRCHQDRGTTRTELAQWAASYLQSHLEILSSGGVPGVRLTGLKGFTYTIESTEDLAGWMPLGTNTADANGLLNFPDNTPPGIRRFYRAVEK
jgi:hypothetical protein